MERELLPILALVIAAFGFLATHYRSKSYIDLSDKLREEIGECSERLAKIETRVEVYFDLQEKYNAAILHRPDHKDVDELLEKREALEPLPERQSQKLDEELEQIIFDKKQPLSMRAAAAQLLSARLARKATECSS